MTLLPSEDEILQMFDALVERGTVVWKHNEPSYHHFGPMDFEFRVSPTLKKKPIYPPYNSLHEAQEAMEASKPPFSDPDNDPTRICNVDRYTLVFNKYSFLRPQFVLHTTKFEPQEDRLQAGDFAALQKVIRQLGPERYIAFFNCGGDAGASVAHKHLQLVPRPERSSMTLWPDDCSSAKGPTRHSGIPFSHLLHRIDLGVPADTLARTYNGMCDALGAKTDSTFVHNFVMTQDWMVVVPRFKPRIGGMGVNAMGMLGMQWCGSETQKEEWLSADPFTIICQLGVMDARDP